MKKIFARIGVPAARPLVPDPFQVEALAAVEQSDCLVTAPTGSGKTWIAEKAMARIHAAGGQCWYACPLKALSNAKYAEFSAIFGPDQVGILTGDRKENPAAPIIVGTTEILRNQLYDAMGRGESLAADLVILDEAHFLGDEDRGVVWEEIMIYLPVRIPLLLLSATVGNAHQIASWLASIRSKKCAVIEAAQRPVPLFPLFLHPGGTLLPLTEAAGSSGNIRLCQKVSTCLKSRRSARFTRPGRLPPFGDILAVLKKYHLLPAIFFLKSRADCDQALELCWNNRVTEERKANLARMVVEVAGPSSHILNHRQRRHLENLAVGAHHSGQLPAWKLVLERLMTAGQLDAVFATSTVAAGVNFPARTVVFLNSDRFNGHQFLPLDATEFHQMTGRAGRRGMDNIGFALLLPGKFMDVRRLARLLHSPASEITSRIRINFSMVLNLLLSHRPEQIEMLLEKSFANYTLRAAKGRRRPREGRYDLQEDFKRHLDFLQHSGYVTADGELSEDGLWASQLRVDQPLLIAEGFRRKILPDSDPELLAAIIAAFVNERPCDERLPQNARLKLIQDAFRRVTQGLKPVVKKMAARGFETRPLYLRPAVAVYAWAAGRSWEKATAQAEMEEGDFAMLILRTADNLRHIRGLKPFFPIAAATAARALERILREPVSYG